MESSLSEREMMIGGVRVQTKNPALRLKNWDAY